MNRQPDSHRIAALAYQIWESRGRPQGQSEEHWREAERRALEEDSDGSPEGAGLQDDPAEAGPGARKEDYEQDTPGRAKTASSRQQTQHNQALQSGSADLDRRSSPAK